MGEAWVWIPSTAHFCACIHTDTHMLAHTVWGIIATTNTSSAPGITEPVRSAWLRHNSEALVLCASHVLCVLLSQVSHCACPASNKTEVRLLLSSEAFRTQTGLPFSALPLTPRLTPWMEWHRCFYVSYSPGLSSLAMFMKPGLLQGLLDFLRANPIAGMLNAETATGQTGTINYIP